ncbi:MAG: carboxypeptidase-like regulatory domain-containing protein [Thermoplasmata archaeon]|nr:MAG: carboxypeptidase-like regulatory domain-containing protein [Thermoplasmata archaeon]
MRNLRLRKSPKIIAHHRTPEVHIYHRRTFFESINKRVILAIILLILVFTLGLSNAFIIWKYDRQIFDPNRFEEASHITISGKVIDKETGELLEGVTISIKNANTSVKTNQDGWFTLENIETGIQTISAQKSDYKIGIKKVYITSTKIPIINFELIQGEGEIYEELVDDYDTNQKAEMDPAIAVIYGIFACFAIPAIVLIFYKKKFWLAAFFVILSMLSIGFIFGTIIGAFALILLFSIKNDFTHPPARPAQITEHVHHAGHHDHGHMHSHDFRHTPPQTIPRVRSQWQDDDFRKRY